jgi:hypothetical protein
VLQRLKSLVDTFLAEGCICARFRRIGDGPDLVHLSVLGKQLLKLGGNPAGHRAAQYRTGLQQVARHQAARPGQQWQRRCGAEPGRVEGIEVTPLGNQAGVQFGKLMRAW